MAARLQRLQALRAGQKRLAEADHKQAVAAQAKSLDQLQQPYVQAGRICAASHLQAIDAQRQAVARQLPQQANAIAQAQKALMLASVEHKKVERMMARQAQRQTKASERREAATMENWLRQRRAPPWRG